MPPKGGNRDAGARRRAYAGPGLFSYGFRPFFLFGMLWGGLAPPVWAVFRQSRPTRSQESVW